MPTAISLSQEIREFIVSNFLYGQESTLTDDDSFLAKGIVDSTGVLQLVTFLEETYGITVEDEELTPEYLDSISSVTAYLCRKMNVGAVGVEVQEGAPGESA